MSSKRRHAEKREMQIGREYADEHEARSSLEGRPFALLGYDERMREIQQEREHPNGLGWYPMSTARRENMERVILLHRTHGVIEGWFSKGTWSDSTPDHPAEYSGSSWIIGEFCGHTWRPAIVNTVGVQFLPGFQNCLPGKHDAHGNGIK